MNHSESASGEYGTSKRAGDASADSEATADPLAEQLERLLRGRGGLRVLDVGCGYRRHVRFGDSPIITGIDTSPEALARHPDLNERVLGDIQEISFVPGSFDVVYCNNVLEHLSKPWLALDHMIAALSPAGLLILGMPNVLSTKGMVTKLTPYRFHLWFHRRVKKSPSAGQPGYGPFPTFLRLSLSPAKIRRGLLSRGLKPDLFVVYEPKMRVLDEIRWVRWCFRAASIALQIVSLGRVGGGASEIAAIFRAPR